MPLADPIDQRLLPGSLFTSLNHPRIGQRSTIAHPPMPITIALILVRVTPDPVGHGFSMAHGPDPNEIDGTAIHSLVASVSDTAVEVTPDGSVDIPANDYIWIITANNAIASRSEITLVLE